MIINKTLLAEIYAKHLDEAINNYLTVPNYAPDLSSNFAKLKRAKNIATKKAAGVYMETTLLGYDSANDDVINCEDRARHHGVAIGAVIGKRYIKARNYDDAMAYTIKQIRKLN